MKKEIVSRVGIKRAKGYLYFVTKGGDIARSKMKKGGTKGHRSCR